MIKAVFAEGIIFQAFMRGFGCEPAGYQSIDDAGSGEGIYQTGGVAGDERSVEDSLLMFNEAEVKV